MRCPQPKVRRSRAPRPGPDDVHRGTLGWNRSTWVFRKRAGELLWNRYLKRKLDAMGTMHEPHDITNPPPLADAPSLPRVWLRRGLLAVAIFLLLTAGAATLAGFNGRQGWRWELLCHFRVQYFWGLAASFAMFAFLRHWFLAATAAVLAAANLALIVPLYFGPSDSPPAVVVCGFCRSMCISSIAISSARSR